MKRYLPCLAALFIFIGASPPGLKDNLIRRSPGTPDLVITDLNFDQWDTIVKSKGSYLSVTVKNKGSAQSSACSVKLYDLDIPFSEAKKQGRFSKRGLAIILEDEEERKNGEDDLNFEPVIVEVPSLGPGQEIKLVMYVKDHWVFDPNIDVEAQVDPDNKVNEKNEENNKRVLLQNG
jgi:hypothetical protein